MEFDMNFLKTKLKLFVTLVLVFNFVLSSTSYASMEFQEKSTKQNVEKKVKSEKSNDKKESNKLICIVTKEDADPALSMEYKGKVYHFCCKKCVKKFKENPEKYIGKL